MRFDAKVEVTLRPGVLDPGGRAIEQALLALGHSTVEEVRIGKLIQVVFEAADQDEARSSLEDMGRRLLANPVLEDFVISSLETVSEEGGVE